MPDLEEIRETVKDTVKDAAQQITDATRDAVQQLVQQSLLQLIETAKTLAEQAVVGAKHSAETVAASHAAAGHFAGSNSSAARDGKSAQETAKPAPAIASKSDAEPEGKEPPMEEQSGGGFWRFVLVGLIVGALVAYFTQRGGEDDEDFGEENWIEVKHDEGGTGPARTDQAPQAASSGPAESESTPSQQELDARATDH